MMRKKTCKIALVLALPLLISGCSWFGGKGNQMAENIDEILRVQNLKKEALLNRETEVNQNPVELERRGDNLSETGAWGAAINQYGEALKIAPEKDRERIKFKIANISLEAKLYEYAQSIYSSILIRNPDSHEAYLGLGLSQLALNNLDDALTNLQKALEGNDKFWKGHNALGIIYNRRRDPQLAISHFQKAIRVDPRNATLHNNIALSYMMLQDFSSAEDSLKRAIILNPKYTLAYNNLGLLLAKCGREEEALYAFEKGGDRAKAHANLGCVLANQGEYKKAIDNFRQAINISPGYDKETGKKLRDVEQIMDLQGNLPDAVEMPR